MNTEIKGGDIIKQQDNSLGEGFKLVQSVWRHREGINLFGHQLDEVKVFGKTLYLEHKIPGIILDVIDQLWQYPKPKPLLTHKKKSNYSWHLVFTIPPGLSFQDVLQKQNYFEDATRRIITIEKINGYLHMNISEGELKNYYPYEWNPEPFLKDMDLPIPIGHTNKGLVVADLAEFPHMKVGGTTLTGKSNALHNFFISLSMLDNVRLAVIDLALLEFSYVKNHALFASEPLEALYLLVALEKEMHRRRYILNKAGVEKIQEYKGEDLPFIVLLIDEFAFFNPEGVFNKEEKEIRKQCHSICSNIAALARKVGIHIILAMQRPDHKILPGQLKANLPGTLSFKTIDKVNSEIILDNGNAANLPNIKGRAIWQIGNQQMEVQVMHLPLKKAKKILYGMEKKEDDWILQSTKRLLPR